jgi:hypothetical protein
VSCVEHAHAVQRGFYGEFGIVDREAASTATSTCLPFPGARRMMPVCRERSAISWPVPSGCSRR